MSDARRERFYCSECGQEIAGEFVEMLRRGEQVFCEACGSRIKVKVQKTVGLPRVEKARPQPPTYPPAPSPPPKPLAPVPIAREPGMDEILAAQRSEMARTAQGQGIKKVPDWQASLSKTNKNSIEQGIQVLNKLSLIISVLILALAGPGALIATAGTTHFYWQIALVVCALGSIITDVRFFNLIAQKDYSFRGIDLIVWGFIGCFGYGVGALVLVKGLCVLAYTSHPKSGYPKLTRTQWFQVIISRLNANSIYVGFLIWSGTFAGAIATVVGQSAPEFIGFIIIGFVVLLVDKYLFTPKLKKSLANRRSAELGLGMIAAGIIGTFDCAMGVLLLLKGLAVILLSGLPEPPQKPAPTPVPTEATIQPQAPVEVPPVGSTKTEQPSVVPTPLPTALEPTISIQKTPTSKTSPAPAPVKPIQASVEPAEPAGKIQGGFPGSEDFEKQAAIQGYLNRVYTVLSSKIRDRVQKLNIPEGEKREIIDGLLNLTPQEQEQFLTELEELARRLMPEIVGRILRLNLSKEQNEVLLRQLEYLSDQEQLEFVAELERARLGTA